MDTADQKAPAPWRDVFRGNILQLGLVSFFTDLSSEMIYPLLPAFFTGLVPPAMAAVYIGLMDGLAESVSSLLKIYAGRLSDAVNRRKPLALAGYGISSAVRPLMSLSIAGWHVIALRFFDRIGKGIRTAPRDALLSESVDSRYRGLAFSFHRLMDHCGAVGGPLLAVGILSILLGRGFIWQQGSGTVNAEEMTALRWLFALALIPGIAATLVMWQGVRESKTPTPPGAIPVSLQNTAASPLSARFFVFLGAVCLFSLGNSSDLFLIFYIQTRFQLGLGWVLILWVMLHVSKIVFSLPGGRLSDRAGRGRAIVIGWLIYLGVYLAMPLVAGAWAACVMLVVYGAYYGMTEGAERALVADIVPAPLRGRAYGWYHGAVGLTALPASLVFGLFWSSIGPRAAFGFGAGAAALALVLLSVYLSLARPHPPQHMEA